MTLNRQHPWWRLIHWYSWHQQNPDEFQMWWDHFLVPSIPCEECYHHAKKFTLLSISPMSNGEQLIEFHNKVNVRLNKPFWVGSSEEIEKMKEPLSKEEIDNIVWLSKELNVPCPYPSLIKF